MSQFHLLKEFLLPVPADYNHDTQLGSLDQCDFREFHSALTDDNFRNTTNRLIPGRTYRVKIFGIRGSVAHKDCFAIYKREHALFVGSQGLAFAVQLKPGEFPKGKCTLSFDKKEALWQNANGVLMVPDVDVRANGDISFNLSDFGNDFGCDACVLCICGKSE